MDNTTTEDTSDTEEEILVYAEFADSVNIEKYNSMHILGIDTKTPIVQMNETFFTGTYENPLGTYMFFENDTSPQSTDPVFDRIPEKNVKYVCKTRKLLKVEHGYITPKDGSGQSTQNQAQQAQEDAIKMVSFKTVQEALDKFKQEWCTNESSSTDNNINNLKES
ncbi:general transcription factor 3C polypeptide 6 [Epargyreus clarus]|uniref:general transcription factor 3C polypeptide 6 n=1 Tax=Epargyreus clarus TaxID=520877 RepID=UPI003C2BC6E1